MNPSNCSFSTRRQPAHGRAAALLKPSSHNITFMKKYLIIPALALLSACQPPLPEVPPSNRTVVQPKGSSDSMKSWNQVTQQEADAVLPFNNMRR